MYSYNSCFATGPRAYLLALPLSSGFLLQKFLMLACISRSSEHVCGQVVLRLACSFD